MGTQFLHAREHSLPEQDTYYVWDAFVRFSHWINAVCTVILIYTGFAIGGMIHRSPVDEPTFGLSMATVRNLHTLAAYIFAANGAVRVYWLFAGDTWGQWFRANFWNANFWRELFWKLRDYLTLKYVGHESYTLGHNALASLAYLVAFVVGGVLVLTGFAMKGQIDQGITQQFFGWVIPLLGGEATVRIVHRFCMWIMIAFMIHHIMIVMLLEVLGERGLISSMFSGVKTKPHGWEPSEKPWIEMR